MAHITHRIVVGVDFGTTFSALAWASSFSPDQIEIIKNWPSLGQLVGSQAPTEIAYEDGNTTTFSWGYNIPPQSRKLMWFKLGLEADDHQNLKLPPGMTVVDVVRDYLSALYKHTMETLYRKFERGVLNATKIDFVLTVPAIWSDAAKKKTENAARLAGIGNEHGLEILSEPEAAALYTLKHSDRSASMAKVNDRIVICDAGGGTVDLISYDIIQIYPLIVRECTAGTGDYCGSTFIDRNFDHLFARRMGRHYDLLKPEYRQQVVKNFETSKIAFRDVVEQPRFFVNVPTVAEIREAGVDGGYFGISREEMRSLFDPVIDRIIGLIEHQVMTVSQGPQRVNSILLVGGFGESEYLFKRVSAWASRYGVQVIQPREAGTPTCQLFIPGRHLEEDAYIDKFTGKKMARNQISWFIRKHQSVTDDHAFNYTFSRHFRTLTPWSDSLVSSDADQPPSRFGSSVRKHCTIISDLTHLKKSRFKRKWRNWRPYYVAEYELVMSLKGGHLGFALAWGGKRWGERLDVEFE
ncbi:MAG: hypothetical protein M1839_002178 [Geoglossum umbratile]|nr:MAG: hypothetical protein M1839_002178 [Geoglossum umbratile]